MKLSLGPFGSFRYYSLFLDLVPRFFHLPPRRWKKLHRNKVGFPSLVTSKVSLNLMRQSGFFRIIHSVHFPSEFDCFALVGSGPTLRLSLRLIGRHSVHQYLTRCKLTELYKCILQVVPELKHHFFSEAQFTKGFPKRLLYVNVSVYTGNSIRWPWFCLEVGLVWQKTDWTCKIHLVMS